mmetsp:Transcript_358/g.916  ORF Transcript_358/g.916 Transcript_358/m.916 type:complete len:416 (+) Transcript_358:113-1360(+)
MLALRQLHAHKEGEARKFLGLAAGPASATADAFEVVDQPRSLRVSAIEHDPAASAHHPLSAAVEACPNAQQAMPQLEPAIQQEHTDDRTALLATNDDGHEAQVAPAIEPETIDLELRAEVRARFVRDGLAIIPEAVDRELVDSLRRQYNHDIGTAVAAAQEAAEADGDGGWTTLPSDPFSNPATLRAKQAVLDAPRLRSAIAALVGPACAAVQPGGQNALNFPGGGVGEDLAWHIDGWNKGKAWPFNLLVAVALSDQTRGDQGNLHAAPGSHVPISNAARSVIAATGPQDPLPPLESLKAMLPATPAIAPTPILLRAGDAALLHPLLAHRRGLNTSPDIRYLLIARFRTLAGGGVRSEGQQRAFFDQGAPLPFPPAVYPGLVETLAATGTGEADALLRPADEVMPECHKQPLLSE